MKKFLLGILLGGTYGMFFAKTTGKKLREEIAKSNTPFKTFLKEGMKVDQDFVKFCWQFLTEEPQSIENKDLKTKTKSKTTTAKKKTSRSKKN